MRVTVTVITGAPRSRSVAGDADDEVEPKDRYGTVRVPDDLDEHLNRFKEDNEWGFRSKTEIVATALRDFFQKYGDE